MASNVHFLYTTKPPGPTQEERKMRREEMDELGGRKGRGDGNPAYYGAETKHLSPECSDQGRRFSERLKGDSACIHKVFSFEERDRSIAALYMSKTDKLYLAAGAEYVRITLGSLTADSGFPKKVAPFWPGTERIGFSEGFDMILKWDDTRAYLFKGPAYARYDLTADKVDDGYPKQTADYWPGMQEAGFADGLDAAVRYDNDTVYFFKGPDYVRYNITNNSVDPGYPRKITTHWDGLAAAGATRVRAAWRTA